MQEFVDLIAAELEKPRQLTAQVSHYISAHYDLSRDDLPRFFSEILPKMEDYEVDLAFSPLFTPNLAEQARFSGLLDQRTLPSSQWPELLSALLRRGTAARVVTEEGGVFPMVLREVSLARFVTRLGLDGVLPERVRNLIDSLAPAGDRALLKALARRPVWRDEARGAILFQFLVRTLGNDTYRWEDQLQLLSFAEVYQPRDEAELLQRLPAWQEVLRKEIDTASSPRPFFNDRVKDMHGGGRDQRGANEAFVVAKKNALAFLSRLQQTLSAAA